MMMKKVDVELSLDLADVVDSLDREGVLALFRELLDVMPVEAVAEALHDMLAPEEMDRIRFWVTGSFVAEETRQ